MENESESAVIRRPQSWIHRLRTPVTVDLLQTVSIVVFDKFHQLHQWKVAVAIGDLRLPGPLKKRGKVEMEQRTHTRRCETFPMREVVIRTEAAEESNRQIARERKLSDVLRGSLRLWLYSLLRVSSAGQRVRCRLHYWLPGVFHKPWTWTVLP